MQVATSPALPPCRSSKRYHSRHALSAHMAHESGAPSSFSRRCHSAQLLDHSISASFTSWKGAMHVVAQRKEESAMEPTGASSSLAERWAWLGSRLPASAPSSRTAQTRTPPRRPTPTSRRSSNEAKRRTCCSSNIAERCLATPVVEL